MSRPLTRDDIMDLADYAAGRPQRRTEMIAIKAGRRLSIGPHVTVMFENAATMWHQIHEMLYIEQGVNTGKAADPAALAAQIDDELAAYNPLIPNGNELIATVMFEIENPDRRDALLDQLGGVEHAMSLSFASETVTGITEGDTPRTNAAGRASSIHFIHFPFTPEQKTLFATAGTKTTFSIAHPAYAHAAQIPEPVRAILSTDFS